MEVEAHHHLNQTVPTSMSGRLKRILLLINILLMSLGNTGGPMLSRLYFLRGGHRVWLPSFLQTAGFPLIALPLFLSYLYRHPHRRPILITIPIFAACAALGLLTGLDDYLYTYGLSFLPVSTSSILISTQLVFTAFFAFIIVRQKFTAFSVNAVALLTVGAAVLGLHTSTDRPAGVSKGEYLKGFMLTLGSAALYGLILPLIELVYEKAKQAITYTLVMEMQLVMGLFATIFCAVGMIVNKDFQVDIETKKIWKLLWSVTGIIPKVKVFNWRLASSSLNVRARLARYCSNISPTCPLCNSTAETTKHLFFFCEKTKEIWNGVGLGLQINNNSDAMSLSDLNCWYRFFNKLSSVCHRKLFMTTLWLIWKHRNDVVFRNSSESIINFRTAAQTLCYDTTEIYLDPLQFVWSKPMLGCLKMNVHASYHTNYSAAGCVIRDCTGKPLIMAGYLSCQANPLNAELWAIKMGILLIIQLEYRNVIIETDSINAVTLLNESPGNLPWCHLHAIKQCKRLLDDQQDIRICHVRRQANKVIPNEAKNFELGEIRYYVVLIWSAIIWQCFFLGAVGVIFCGNTLLAGIVIAVFIPVNEVLGVIFFHEKFSGEKGVALALSLWGLASYSYGEYKEGKAKKTNLKDGSSLTTQTTLISETS